MSEFSIEIDGKAVAASEEMTILDAAERAGIAIPTVCHHEKLKPFGGCRLCTVEAEVGGRANLVAACIYPVQPGLAVKTRSEQIDKIRKILTEQLLARAPESDILKKSRQGLSRRQGPLPARALVLHPLRPVRALLRRDQGQERRRLRRPRADARDQLRPRDR